MPVFNLLTIKEIWLGLFLTYILKKPSNYIHTSQSQISDLRHNVPVLSFISPCLLSSYYL